MKSLFIAPLLVLIMIAIISCEDEGGTGKKNHPPAAPTTPSPVNGATNIDTAVTFTWACSDPDNDDLSYKFFISADNATWYRLNPAYFISPSLNLSGLAFNTTYYWRVRAFDNRDSSLSAIWQFTTRANPPQLSVSPTSLNFGSSTTQMTFNITNTGGGTLSWSITDNQTWISVSPTSGTTTTETDQITVTINRSGLTNGNYNGIVTVTPTTGSAQTVSVSMDVGTSGQPNLTLYTGTGATNQYSFNTTTEVLTATWSIGNNGTAAASAFRAGLYVSTNTTISTSDYLIAYATFNSGLLSGYYQVINYPSVDLDNTSVPYGTYYVGLLIDDLYQVTESNEYDNEWYFTTPISYSYGMAKSIMSGSIIGKQPINLTNALSFLKNPQDPAYTIIYKK